MSDNTTLNPGLGGDTIATEDTGLGYKLPVSKIRLGAEDADGGDVTATNPFPVYLVAGGTGGTAPSGTGQAITPITAADLAVTNRLLAAILRGIAIIADVEEKDLIDG